MNDCVFFAIQEHLDFLGIKTELDDIYWFRNIKVYANAMDKPTPGGLTAALIYAFTKFYDCELEMQYRLVTPSHLKSQADGWLQEICAGWLESKNIELADPLTLQPAIYLLLTHQHAIFSKRVPTFGVPVMALQIRRKTK